MSQHALLSPSSAHRWLHCPASVPLGVQCPDESSAFADEGTVAHELAASALRNDRQASEYVGFRQEINGVAWDITAEMAAYVQQYVDYVRGIEAPRFFELPLLLEAITGERGAQGTADAVIPSVDELIIVDLKYGRGVKVDAKDNEQLQLYALAALEAFDFAGPFQRVRLVIVQPRLGHLDEWVYSVAELHAFKQTVAPRAQRCMDAVKKYGNAGALPQEYFAPGEKPCRFCRAKAICPALRDHVLSTVAGAFVDVTQPVVPPLESVLMRTHDNATLARLLGATALIESWCKGIYGKVEAELLAGRAVPGYKLVEDRRGARRWTAATAVEAMLKRMRVKVEHIYERSLISPTTAEKLHKAGTLGDRQWFLLQDLMTQPDGKPSVVPESDTRPALILQDDASHFQDLTQVTPHHPQKAPPSFRSRCHETKTQQRALGLPCVI
ncbi:hypothetical protein AB672_02465 [Xylella taiwanensis]|nr:DUF2800 domain-containing protein [Xylella taiwanensis]AXI82897.1 hypothetical protein AB672_02465 [Xylella taiwanensis]